MRGPLIEFPTPPSRNPRRLATILALGVGIAGVPGASVVLAQESAPDPGTTTTTPAPAPDSAAPATTTPAPDSGGPAAESQAEPSAPASPPPAAPPPAARLYTPPVGAPLDFAREPLPTFEVPAERPTVRIPAPPPETTPGRIVEDLLGDGADGEGHDELGASAGQTAGGELAGPLAPSTSAARIPNFFIGRFAIPPFLLSIYQAAGIQYGVPWEVLAAINEIETDYGRNLNISSAGATGWMQFMPATWQAYGVDANEDGRKDPYNPVDAIFAAARYLKAAGAGEDLRKAIFAYNHANWYVDAVLARARFVAGLPSDLVGSLTGLSQGRSPIAARMTYTHRAAGAPARHELHIDAPEGAPVVAVQDGRIMRVGNSPRLGRFVMLRDVYGNTYTYAHLGKLAHSVLVAKEQVPAKARAVRPLAAPAPDPVPSAPASAGSNRSTAKTAAATTAASRRAAAPQSLKAGPPTPAAGGPAGKERLFANPARTRSLASGGRRQILDASFALPASASLRSYFAGDVGLERSELELKRMFSGRRVIAGTILGRVGSTTSTTSTTADGTPPHVVFSIRPPGKGVPRIDPEPFIEGWRLLESTNVFRARGAGALSGGSVGQILLMSKDTLAKRVLANPNIDIYDCGRRDILAGIVDRRVLATLEFLAANGLNPTVSSIRCGHRFFTETGGISQHASGNGVDISKINGQAILGSQGPGSITDTTVRRLLTLQGTMAPAQIISLMSYPGVTNALAMADHADHIHVGFRPLGGTSGGGIHALGLQPKQWLRLVDRLGRIANPLVSRLRRP